MIIISNNKILHFIVNKRSKEYIVFIIYLYRFTNELIILLL